MSGILLIFQPFMMGFAKLFSSPDPVLRKSGWHEIGAPRHGSIMNYDPEMKQERECHDIKMLEPTNGTRTTCLVSRIPVD